MMEGTREAGFESILSIFRKEKEGLLMSIVVVVALHYVLNSLKEI